MTDALAAILDTAGNPPRQGDGDDASGLLLDAPEYNRWKALLSTGRVLFGDLPWWPANPDLDLRTQFWTSGIRFRLCRKRVRHERPNLFADAGHVYLRSKTAEKEIWCRCDHGPHGFLSIAAHAHADALAIELRVNDVDVLADPGTYCYHGEREWRDYFRSTIGHNTLELLSQDQSISGGPFLWTTHAQSKLIKTSGWTKTRRSQRGRRSTAAIRRTRRTGTSAHGDPRPQRSDSYDRRPDSRRPHRSRPGTSRFSSGDLGRMRTRFDVREIVMAGRQRPS